MVLRMKELAQSTRGAPEARSEWVAVARTVRPRKDVRAPLAEVRSILVATPSCYNL